MYWTTEEVFFTTGILVVYWEKKECQCAKPHYIQPMTLVEKWNKPILISKEEGLSRIRTRQELLKGTSYEE
jgi:hypothetical protein